MREPQNEFVHAAAHAAAERRRAVVEGDRGLGLFSSIQTRKVSDEVLGILVDALRGGIYEVGDMLPPERDLAERLGVSRKVLREAIERLRSEGIVAVRRGATGGTIVESLENLAELCAQIQGETRTSLRSLLEIRRPIEWTGAILAGQKASDSQQGSLWRLVQLLDDVIDNPKEFWEIDMRFHIAVAEFSGNTYCARFLREIINGLSVIKQQFPYAHVPHQQAITNQRETCEAIVSGDPAAILQAMDAHLADLEYVLLGERLNMSDPMAALRGIAGFEPAAGAAPSVAG
jgi:GntR family transcriptional repressor for pyruvate dehydrogenase complex